MNIVELREKKIVIVEGKDDDNFIVSLIQNIGLHGIQVIPFEGNTDWSKKLSALVKMPNFSTLIESVGIIRDSDSDMDRTFKSVCTTLANNGLDVPKRTMETTTRKPKIIVMLWPFSKENGSLEDLCLLSIAEYPEMKCIEAYFDCLKSTLKTMPKNMSKSKVQAFLASREEACPHLGIGATKNYWPFEHDVFNETKIFLKSL